MQLPGKNLRANRLAFLQVIGIEKRNVFTAFDASLPRESREVVYGARICFEHAVDDEVMRFLNTSQTQIKEVAPVLAVHADDLEQTTDRVLAECRSGIVDVDAV